MINESVFSFFIFENKQKNAFHIPKLPVIKEFGKYTVYTDGNTPFVCASNETVACAIFGIAVNVVTGKKDNLAKEIVENCSNMEDLVAYEQLLGGKYMLLYRNEERYYVLCDATSSIPIYYNTDEPFICASNCQDIVNARQYRIDEELAYIRKNGDISQAMPYDITPFRQIKQLIPNHYLDVNKQVSVRFVNSLHKQKSISVEEATDIALPMIKNILNLYLQRYKIYCPITSGRDSRVVLSFLQDAHAAFTCYTIKHPEHNNRSQDVVIPVELCEKVNLEHKIVKDITLSEVLIKQMDLILGKECYSLRTLRIAQTINEYFGDGAIINGDIIGQVGKCSLHRDIPSVFATPSYFRCKLHNYSNGAKLQLKQWMDEIKRSGEKVNYFDLFSVENRLGRWAGQENTIYNTLGQVYLNIFNSRSIIYTWSAVEREKRKKSLLHLDLLNRTSGILATVPFEKDESLLYRISKATGLTYLLSSYAKFYIEKIKFIVRKKK